MSPRHEQRLPHSPHAPHASHASHPSHVPTRRSNFRHSSNRHRRCHSNRCRSWNETARMLRLLVADNPTNAMTANKAANVRFISINSLIARVAFVQQRPRSSRTVSAATAIDLTHVHGWGFLAIVARPAYSLRYSLILWSTCANELIFRRERCIRARPFAPRGCYDQGHDVVKPADSAQH